MIICIPTLGRPTTKTYKLFEDSGFQVFHFIEPQEMGLYHLPNKINIMKTGQGISYVRNFINRWARENNFKYIAVCDDDVNHFGVAKNGKSVKTFGADALKPAFEIFKNSNFALGGVNQRQFAWTQKKTYRINAGKVEMLHIINTSFATWEYDSNGKEDRDYVMQCINNGHSFVFFPKIFLNAPKIGSNIGGLHDYYKDGKDTKAAFELARKWAKYAKITKQYGRVDCKLDYSRMAKDKGLKVI